MPSFFTLGGHSEPCDSSVVNLSWPSVPPLDHLSLKCPLHRLASMAFHESECPKDWATFQITNMLVTMSNLHLALTDIAAWPFFISFQIMLRIHLPYHPFPHPALTQHSRHPSHSTCAPVHSSAIAGLTWWYNSFRGFLPYQTLTFTRVGTVTSESCYPQLPTQCLVSLLLFLITHVIQGNKFK